MEHSMHKNGVKNKKNVGKVRAMMMKKKEMKGMM